MRKISAAKSAKSQWKQVYEYQTAWRLEDDLGIIFIFFNDGSFEELRPKSLTDLSALADMLRNEKPIFFHTKTRDLTTGREPTGEQEGGINYPKLRA